MTFSCVATDCLFRGGLFPAFGMGQRMSDRLWFVWPTTNSSLSDIETLGFERNQTDKTVNDATPTGLVTSKWPRRADIVSRRALRREPNTLGQENGNVLVLISDLPSTDFKPPFVKEERTQLKLVL